MTRKKSSIDREELKRLLFDEGGGLRPLLQATLQEILEGEMDETPGAGSA